MIPTLFTALVVACGFLLGLRVGLVLGKRNAEKAALAKRKR
jgi:hypothetical protein